MRGILRNTIINYYEVIIILLVNVGFPGVPALAFRSNRSLRKGKKTHGF